MCELLLLIVSLCKLDYWALIWFLDIHSKGDYTPGIISSPSQSPNIGELYQSL